MPGRVGPPAVLNWLPKWYAKDAGESPRPVSSGRMDDHPRRLIDDRQPRILVEDFQRNVLRAGRLPRDVGENRRHFLTDLKAVGGLSALAPYSDAARSDDPAEVYPAIAREMMGQKRHPGASPPLLGQRKAPPVQTTTGQVA